MEIVVSVLAVAVAATCLVAFVRSDLKDSSEAAANASENQAKA